MSNSIKVGVRCRPLFDQEKPATGLDIQSRRILLDSKTYDPDYTFAPSASQDDIFEACRPILQCVKDGLNGTVMVYGQTGTGKTFTMLGHDGQDDGLVHKIIAHMLEHVQLKTLDGGQCALTLSMIEIYNEKLTDMLSPNGDEEVTLIGGFPRFTHKVTLCRLSDANEAVTAGLAWRHTAATMMNERSSRSHVVFIIDLEELNAYTEETEVAHLFLVDLAGSESLKKSQATGTTAGEAGKINKSLLALKSVFLALSNTNEATRPVHVPYRDSRLTELLQDSIGGTARTLMIACISAVGRDIEETKSTLMYAVKAKSIRNASNTEKEKLLIRLRSIEVENQRLRNRLQERVNERGGYYITKEEHERYQQQEEEVQELRQSVAQLVQDRQTSDTRKHISESQTKLLQAMVEDKDAELQRFKTVYYEALRRFETQAHALQRVVQGAVRDAKTTASTAARSQYGQLEGWRRALLHVLETTPDLTAATDCTEAKVTNDEEGVGEGGTSATTITTAAEVSCTTFSSAATGDVATIKPEGPQRTSGFAVPLLPGPLTATHSRPPQPATSCTATNTTTAGSVFGSSNSSGGGGAPQSTSRGSVASNSRTSSGSRAVHSAQVSPARRGRTGRTGRQPPPLPSAPTSSSSTTSAAPPQPCTLSGLSSLEVGSAKECGGLPPPPPLPPTPTGSTTASPCWGTVAVPLAASFAAAAAAAAAVAGALPVVSTGLTPTTGSATTTTTTTTGLAFGALNDEAPSASSSSSSPLLVAVDGGAGTGVFHSVPSADSTEHLSTSTFLDEFDDTCRRVVQRVNGAFHELAQRLLTAHEEYSAHATQLEQHRSSELASVCDEMRASLDASLKKLQRVDSHSCRDAGDARQGFHDRLLLATRYPTPAEPTTLQHAMRHACARAVQTVLPVLPPPDLTDEVTTALDAVLAAYQTRWSSIAFGALTPLSSFPTSLSSVSGVGTPGAWSPPPQQSSASTSSQLPPFLSCVPTTAGNGLPLMPPLAPASCAAAAAVGRDGASSPVLLSQASACGLSQRRETSSAPPPPSAGAAPAVSATANTATSTARGRASALRNSQRSVNVSGGSSPPPSSTKWSSTTGQGRFAAKRTRSTHSSSGGGGGRESRQPSLSRLESKERS